MALDLPSIILQAGQMITESLRSAQQTQLQREQLKQRQADHEETMKLRETKLKVETELAGLKLEKEKALLTTAKVGATVATATATDKIEQEKMQTSTGVLGLEKLNQEVRFNAEMEPYRRTIIESNAQLKRLEADAGAEGPDALSRTLDNVNQRAIIQGRIVSIAEDAGKLHVKQAGIRDQILGSLGPQFTQKYGSREYGWFYARRDALTKATQADPDQALVSMSALGILPTAGTAKEKLAAAGKAAGAEIQELNQVIGSFEAEVSKFVSSSVDLAQVPINLKEMSRKIAFKAGSGSQSAGTFTQVGQAQADGTTTPGPEQTAPQVQMEKILTADPATGAQELLRAASDQSRAKGIGGGAAISNILQSIPDAQRRAALVEQLRALNKNQNGQ